MKTLSLCIKKQFQEIGYCYVALQSINVEKSLLVQGQMYHIPRNLASNVNLSYCMNLWTLESKLHKNSCWTFFQ